MERLTLSEFLEEIQNDLPILHDGHELGLIIDDCPEESERLKRLLRALEERVASVSLDVDVVSEPEKLKTLVDKVNGGDAIVLLRADRPLLPKHYAALQCLVNHHALEQWSAGGRERSMVSFHEGSRFILVMPRKTLEESWSTFPPLKGIIGTTFSCDVNREEVVC